MEKMWTVTVLLMEYMIFVMLRTNKDAPEAAIISHRNNINGMDFLCSGTIHIHHRSQYQLFDVI